MESKNSESPQSGKEIEEVNGEEVQSTGDDEQHKESNSGSSKKIALNKSKDINNGGTKTSSSSSNEKTSSSSSSSSQSKSSTSQSQSSIPSSSLTPKTNSTSAFSIYNPETEVEHLENSGMKKKKMAIAASFKKKTTKKVESSKSGILELPEPKLGVNSELAQKEIQLTHFTIYGLLADILENVKNSKNHVMKPYSDILTLLSDTSSSPQFKGGIKFMQEEIDRKLPGLCGKKLINFLSYSLIQLKHWLESEVKNSSSSETHWYKNTIKDLQDIAIDMVLILLITSEFSFRVCKNFLRNKMR